MDLSLLTAGSPEASPRRRRPLTAVAVAGLLTTAAVLVALSAASSAVSDRWGPLAPGVAAPPNGAGPNPTEPSPVEIRPDPEAEVVVLPAVQISPPPHPLDALPQSELPCRVVTAPGTLGAASLGAPNRGALFNAARFEADDRWVIETTENAWATPEAVAALARAIDVVRRTHPGTPPLHLGDASRERGGYLRPHRSHQAGRDVDVGFYYTTGPAWYVGATAANLDRARTWTLLRALIADGEVEYVFLDSGVQALLIEHATALGEDPAWLAELFGSEPRHEGPVRHARGHRTHLHVRFYSPQAVESGVRLGPYLSPWNGRPTTPAWRCAKQK